jgi:hypothetical protein
LAHTVLEVTGQDLAAFCDARLPEQHDAYLVWRRGRVLGPPVRWPQQLSVSRAP